MSVQHRTKADPKRRFRLAGCSWLYPEAICDWPTRSFSPARSHWCSTDAKTPPRDRCTQFRVRQPEIIFKGFPSFTNYWYCCWFIKYHKVTFPSNNFLTNSDILSLINCFSLVVVFIYCKITSHHHIRLYYFSKFL